MKRAQAHAGGPDRFVMSLRPGPDGADKDLSHAFFLSAAAGRHRRRHGGLGAASGPVDGAATAAVTRGAARQNVAARAPPLALARGLPHMQERQFSGVEAIGLRRQATDAN
jgi:hypothetical protein